MTHITTYVDIRIQEARTAASTGRDQQAEETLQQTAAFGERMTATSETDIERLVAMLITRRGLEGLRDFYAEHGRKEEAASAALRISKLEEISNKLVRNYPQKYSETAASFRRTAVWVQASAGLAV